MTDLAALLREFYAEKLDALQRHIAAARLVGGYDANNAYQYVINREETQLDWVGRAILDLGGDVNPSAAEVTRTADARGDQGRGVMAEDARDAQAFIDRWTPRVAAMPNARHRKMLQVVLGEVAEQRRFFEQAVAGDQSLLGKRTEAAGARVGRVMSTRWIGKTIRVAVALGSNLGDRRAHLAFARTHLEALLGRTLCSSWYETAPVGVGEQPPYLNGAIVGDTSLAAADLLQALFTIERERGRERPHPGAPRTLDLDLILYGDAVMDGPELMVPHPRFREREFVLEPLAEVAPDLRDPVTGLTTAHLLARLRGPGASRTDSPAR